MNFSKIIKDEGGHGYIPSAKDLIKLGLVIITFPISVPAIIIKEKIKKKKVKKSREIHNRRF